MPDLYLYEIERSNMQLKVDADGNALDTLKERPARDLEALRNFEKSRPRPKRVWLRGRWFGLMRYLRFSDWWTLVLAHRSLMAKIAVVRRRGGE